MTCARVRAQSCWKIVRQGQSNAQGWIVKRRDAKRTESAIDPLDGIRWSTIGNRARFPILDGILVKPGGTRQVASTKPQQGTGSPYLSPGADHGVSPLSTNAALREDYSTGQLSTCETWRAGKTSFQRMRGSHTAAFETIKDAQASSKMLTVPREST